MRPRKAARSALANTLQSANVRECATRHGRQTEQLVEQLGRFLKEGVVNDEFLLDSRESVLKVIRQANVTLRWMLLHTNPLSAGTPGTFYKKEHFFRPFFQIPTYFFYDYIELQFTVFL